MLPANRNFNQIVSDILNPPVVSKFETLKMVLTQYVTKIEVGN